MTFSLGGVRVRMHPLIPLLWGVSALMGQGGSLIASLIALLFHESGHLMAAKTLGIRWSGLEITPFGGVITTEGTDRQPPWKRFVLAAMGPLFSLLGCLAAGRLYRAGLPFLWAQRLVRFNFLLLIINLLPALPLDGGEMLRALLLFRFPHAQVTRALNGVGYGVGALLCLLTLGAAWQGKLLLSPLFAGMYLLYAVTIRRRESAAWYVTALIGRRVRLEQGEALPVEWMAVGADTSVGTILRRLSPGKYHMLCVLSPDGLRSLGTVNEQTLCEQVMTDVSAPIGQYLSGQTKKDQAHPNA